MTVRDNSYGQAPLQEVMLTILQQFINICEENNLRYWLSGGTCLGVLRHQGFIPWDDDLDVHMPRPDYEKLWSLADEINACGKYVLCRTTFEKNYHHRVMQLVDTETTFINMRSINEDIEHGVYIDIIPVDAQRESAFGRFSQKLNAVIFSVYNIQCKPEFYSGALQKVLSVGTSAMLAVVKNPKARYRLWKRAEQRMIGPDWDSAETYVSLAESFKTLFFRSFPKDWIQPRRAKFEGVDVIIPSAAEDYCTLCYGDYLALPPVSSRKPRHNTEFIDLNTSYKEYKGVLFCKSE